LGYTFGDIGGCNCCRCFGCPLPASFHIDVNYDSGAVTASGTVSLIAATTLVWKNNGATSNRGCCYEGSFPASNLRQYNVQIVCSGACTAMIGGGPATSFGYGIYNPGGCDTCGADNYSLISATCSPLSIVLRVPPGTPLYQWTITP